MSIIQLMTSGIYLGIFLLLYLSYSAMDESYNAGKEKSPTTLSGFTYVHYWIQYSSLIIGIASFHSDNALLLKYVPFTGHALAGTALSVIGTSIFLAAKAELGSNYSPCDDQYLPQQIVKTGIYRILRHPIYVGTSLVLWGFALATASLWLCMNAVLLSLFQYRSAKMEERALASRFVEYRTYLENGEEVG